MASGAAPILRVPLILLAVGNLAILGVKLWPWPDAMSLPGNGVVALDPTVSLLGYIGMIYLIASSKQAETRKALGMGTMLGLLAGIAMVAEIQMKAHAALDDTTPSGLMTKGLLGVACLLWGISGFLGARAGGNGGVGMLSGAWSAIVSCLMASTAILTEMYFAGPPPISQDPWKQYEGLAIGNTATQALVHSLNSATFFLLVGPLAGAGIGLVFALFAPDNKG